jgi:hypothetical protein
MESPVTRTWPSFVRVLAHAFRATGKPPVPRLDLGRLSPHDEADLNLPLDVLARRAAEEMRRRIWP